MPSLVPSDVPSSAPSSKMASAPLAMPGSDPTTLESGIGLGARKGVLVAAVVVLLGGVPAAYQVNHSRAERTDYCAADV
jgi:hypothetical protein